MEGFPGGSAGKESACKSGDLGSIPGLGRYPEEGNGYPPQYSGLKNSMDCIVHGVTKSQTWLSDFHFHFTVWKGYGLLRRLEKNELSKNTKRWYSNDSKITGFQDGAGSRKVGSSKHERGRWGLINGMSPVWPLLKLPPSLLCLTVLI